MRTLAGRGYHTLLTTLAGWGGGWRSGGRRGSPGVIHICKISKLSQAAFLIGKWKNLTP
jgi:hypothetical protein